MLFRNAMELLDGWNKHCPPTNELVAAYLGFEGSGSQSGPNELEQALLARTPTRTFESLPDFIKQRLKVPKDKK
jgi:hypothetical protein